VNGTSHETEVSGCMNKRRLRIIKFVAIAVAVMVLAWGASAIAVYAVSSGRVFDSASILGSSTRDSYSPSWQSR